VRLGAERSPVEPVGCGSTGREMAENGTVDRSSTTPPSPSFPTNHTLAYDNGQTNITSTDGQQGRLLASPRCNGYGGASPISKGNSNDVKHSGLVPSPTLDARSIKTENDVGGVELHGRSQQHSSGKSQSEQDGPLDFSLRRRDSVSETFTDDSQASSSISPPPTSGSGQPLTTVSSRLSPESDHGHHYQHPGFGHQQNHEGQAHGRNNASTRSGGGSPDNAEPIGQPKTAPPMTSSAGGGSRSPGGSSMGPMGLLPDGSPGNSAAAAAAMLGQNGSMLGSMGNLAAFMADPRRVQGGNGGKVQRPFKAYPKEALQMPLGYLGMPGMNPFASMDPSALQGLTVSQDELMSIYKQQLDFLKERDKQLMSISKMITGSTTSSTTPSTSSPSATSNGSNGSSVTAHQPSPTIPSAPLSSSSAPSPYFPHTSPPTNPLPSAPPSLGNSYSPGAHTSLSSTPFPPPAAPPLVSSTSSLAGGSTRKRPRVLPDNQKDEAYWERRRKNNDAAKRSRDARRAKEDEIAIRAALLEQENLKLRVEVAALKTETARLRCMLYNS
ncbi:hypothetical protein BaRGS_00035075, partial [Batillaria attramentaria]